jgi:hypothetical protein
MTARTLDYLAAERRAALRAAGARAATLRAACAAERAARLATAGARAFADALLSSTPEPEPRERAGRHSR